MNALEPIEPINRKSKTMTKNAKRLSGDHRGFSRLGLLSAAVVFAGLGGFAAYAPLDSAAIAVGRVAAETSSKPLQHLEGGIVREILVSESTRVTAGQVLFRLEPTQAMASTEILQKQVDAALASEARLTAEREFAPVISFPAALAARLSVSEVKAAVDDQAKQFDERRQSLANQVMILEARVSQSQREVEGLAREQQALKDQSQSLATEIANVSGLAAKGYYPKNKLMALQREQLRVEGQLGSIHGDIGRKVETITEARLQMVQVRQSYREEAAGKLAEVRNRLSELAEKQKVAADVMSRIEIRAPQDGIVQGIKVHAAGAVVRPGEAIAELIPTGDKLVMASRVSPLDIDSVRPGQVAEIRFASFSSRSLPIITGTVESIGADTQFDDVTRQPYYAAKVVVEPTALPDHVAERLLPGMPADVLIATGERTLLQYLTDPITTLFATSMREQ